MQLVHQFKAYKGNVWRVIEGQYRPATRKIVDTEAEQKRLEELIEESKPPMPDECKELNYQFSAPFRYGVYPGHSRFRRPGRTSGVFYSAETSRTAAIETAWNSIKFYRASEGTPYPSNPVNHTAVSAEIHAFASIDLTDPAMENAAWTAPDDYEACRQLADEVREAGCEAIRYHSVRDPDRGCNVAVLSCKAFAQTTPIDLESLKIFLTGDRAVLANETLRQTFEYSIGEHRLIQV